jgi:TolB-like protein/Tfp pilus assembly protein PilF
LGEKEKALAQLERAIETREAWMVWMGVEPVFDTFRNDPRFMNLLERTGNPHFHREKTIVMSKHSTVESEKNPTKINESPEITRSPNKISSRIFPNWSVAVLGLLIILGITAFIALRFGFQKGWEQNSLTTTSTEKNLTNTTKSPVTTVSIAILPFTTVGAKSDDEQYLGVGTADLVTSKLSQISEINLRAASSVRRYLKTDKQPVEIGKELAVDYVVSGTIQRIGESVEAKLEMIETNSGRIVWSEIFDEPNNNLFSLQDSISEIIAKSLSLRLTTAEKQNLAKHFTENGTAQQFYLAGRYHFGKRTVEGLRQAISLFKQAIETDQNFALAYTGLADCYALLNWYQEPPPPDAWSQARAAALRAVELDDNLAEAHSSLAFIKFHFDRDYTGAENEFRRAINLKPNYATAHQWYSFLLSTQKRHNEAIAVMRHAEELEPRSAVIANAVANVLFYARSYDESIAQVKRSLEIDPSSVGAHAILRWNYEMLNLPDDALSVYEKEVAFAGDTPTSRAKRAHVLAATGKKEEAQKILTELIKTNQIEHITPYEIAVIYSLLNDRNKSLEWLKTAKQQHAVGFSLVNVDPLLDNVRGDKRFESLLQ